MAVAVTIEDQGPEGRVAGSPTRHRDAALASYRVPLDAGLVFQAQTARRADFRPGGGQSSRLLSRDAGRRPGACGDRSRCARHQGRSSARMDADRMRLGIHPTGLKVEVKTGEAEAPGASTAAE